MKLAEVLSGYPNRLWTLSKQVGVTHAVARMPEEVNGVMPWDYMSLLYLKQRFAGHGLKLEVMEPGLDMQKVKQSLPGRDEEIEQVKQLIRNMGALGIPVLCYNFMAQFNWMRSSTSIPTRGGAMVTGYDHEDMRHAPLTEAGVISEDRLWSGLEYFLKRVVPVAEEAGVKLALHPDDPPLSPIRGISRIITSADALKQAIDLVPSDYSGITFCQGTLSTAGENIPEQIRRFGKLDKIFFVHFRDVRGTPEKFIETFHDDGQTDMFEAMKTYCEIGFDGPVRVDHVPTMEGERNDEPGYESLGRLFAVGYLKGLLEGARKTAGSGPVE
ncbi:mannonate dehydratase [Paenibacillus contaminans]|uniref:mannonate dehydratase n=1 Tax=Paenibacillus contaminans TaxID=450362 RepID=A0A329LT32_9BACL|nr:mannonate dehydratase [Paenibacillus contaminans]RAV11111.1 mannonate dehydratase [Paenibacillus contaminans]